MQTVIETLTNQTLVTLQGCLDTAASKAFADDLQPVMEVKDTHIVVDCAQLEYISSSGLRTFILLLKSAKAHNTTLTLQHLTPAVMEVFKMTGFVSIFQIES